MAHHFSRLKSALLVLSLAWSSQIKALESSPAKNECQAPKKLASSDLKSAETILEYFTKNDPALKTVDDLVCCLPEEYLKNYVVGMASDAGQNGTPDGPRIIMYDRRESASRLPPRFMMTFNGGTEHNTQPNSLEMAVFNENTHETALYDLEIKNGAKLTKNPTKCMRCHGEPGNDVNGKQIFKVPFGGTKFIFGTENQWKSFAGGIASCSKAQGETELYNKLADKAVDTVRHDLRYRCLEKGLLQVNKDKNDPVLRYPKLKASLFSLAA